MILRPFDSLRFPGIANLAVPASAAFGPIPGLPPGVTAHAVVFSLL